MIKLEIDSTNNIFVIEHDLACKEHLLDEMVLILDHIIVDCEIRKFKPYEKKTLPELESILHEKRKEYLRLMENEKCTCIGYLQLEVMQEETL